MHKFKPNTLKVLRVVDIHCQLFFAADVRKVSFFQFSTEQILLYNSTYVKVLVEFNENEKVLRQALFF